MAFQLIVFDLDFTLWDAGGTWCDHTRPPYRKVNNHVCDSENSVICLYPGVKDLLKELSHSYTLGVASRTGEPLWAKELMNLFGISGYFAHREIYPGSKVSHFRNLQKATEIDFSGMLFFDDEMRNVEEVARLGVQTVYVKNGISRNLVGKYLPVQQSRD